MRRPSLGEQPTIQQEKARPLLQIYEAWLRAKLERLSSKSDTAKAINYTLNQWSALTLYCEDGTLEIDNNIAEYALRCVSLGRKNFLFAGSDSGGERAAAMYALIGTCRLNEIDPRAYLDYVLTHIAGHKINRIGDILLWCVADKLHNPGSPPDTST